MNFIFIAVRETVYFAIMLSIWHFYPNKVGAFPYLGDQGFRVFLITVRVLLLIIEAWVDRITRHWKFDFLKPKEPPTPSYPPRKSAPKRNP